MVHGDAMPAHFIFGDDGQLTVIDWERLSPGDGAADLGRILAEVRYLLMCKHGVRSDRVQMHADEFLKHYAERVAQGNRRLKDLSRRVKFHIGCDELRISRNAWVGPDEVRHLIDDAERLLTPA
jgi:aminoglycoside phosphotransferase (APT) family kinase protein